MVLLSNAIPLKPYRDSANLNLLTDICVLSLTCSVHSRHSGAAEDELKPLRQTEEFESRLLVLETRPPDAFQMFRYNMRLMDRKRDAVLALLRSTFVPTISDWDEITLPAALYPPYYLFRIQRLLKKYLTGRLQRTTPTERDAAHSPSSKIGLEKLR
jgi:hypothetical protein